MNRPFTVLLVEDNPDDAMLIARYLEDAGRAVASVSSLTEARKHLMSAGADVVLLDLGLPDSRGEDAVTGLSGVFPDVPIVVLTGLDDEDVGQRAVEAGAQDYLVKGRVEPRLLDRSLRYAIERKRAERAIARLAAIMSSLCDECGRRLTPPGGHASAS